MDRRECEKSKPADSAEACSAAALKSCDNSRLDITKYKVITAKFNGARPGRRFRRNRQSWIQTDGISVPVTALISNKCD